MSRVILRHFYSGHISLGSDEHNTRTRTEITASSDQDFNSRCLGAPPIELDYLGWLKVS